MQKWVLASNNQGKLTEFQNLFDKANLPVRIVPQGQLGIDDAVENGLSFIENAIIKARHASKISGLPAIADDSGLCVPVLNNMPGIYSARFAGKHGDDKANNAKLIQELECFYPNGVKGEFVCVLVFVRHANDPLPVIAEGRWLGEILDKEAGENGFGYDSLFFSPEKGCTFAELETVEKKKISHRAKALAVLKSKLSV